MRHVTKFLSWAAVLLGLVCSMVVSAAAQDLAGLPQRLGTVETALYGREQDGAVLPRLGQLEKDLYGQEQTGPLLVRLEKVSSFITAGQGATSLNMKLNAVEWMVYQRLSSGVSILRRLDQVEAGIFGDTQKGKPIADRINGLVQMVWPGGEITPATATVPKQTLVRIRLLDPVTSAKNQPGDRIRYQVDQDVIVDNKVVIPAGTESTATVSAVDSAGRLGRDGRLQIDFGSVAAIDGTMIRLGVDQRATEKNQQSLELAAGASMAGVILLGPVGLVGGYFVKGQDVTIEAQKPFYVEVRDATTVTGLSLNAGKK